MLKHCLLVMCYVIVWCAEISTAREIPKYNFSVNKHNQTGLWYAENLKLEYEGEDPWNMIVNYTSDTKNSRSIVIIDNNILPTPRLNNCLDHKQRPPGPGYQLLTGLGYYKVHSEKVSWLEALETCEQEGAHLYIYNSKEEADAMDALIEKTIGRQIYWLGIHDQFKEGHYVTIFSQTLERPEYMKWSSNERENEDCGCIEYIALVYVFGDYTCSYKHPFVCEKEMDNKF